MTGENLACIIRKQREKINTSHEFLKDSEVSRNNLQRKIEELIQKITKFSQCSNCEKNAEMFKELTKQISTLKLHNKDETKEPNNSFLEPDPLNKELPNTKKLKNFLQAFEKLTKDEEIIESELKSHPDSFTKTSTGQYIFNKTLKVNIFIENSSILCRVGKIFTLPQFTSSFSTEISSKTSDPANISKLSNEAGTCENSFSEEEKKPQELKAKDGIKATLLKSHIKADKKPFTPIRQTANPNDKKRIVSK